MATEKQLRKDARDKKRAEKYMLQCVEIARRIESDPENGFQYKEYACDPMNPRGDPHRQCGNIRIRGRTRVYDVAIAELRTI
jgi:hypothetical protein